MTDEDEFGEDFGDGLQRFSCVFCQAPIEDESEAVTLTATWMPHWISGKLRPLAQEFWAHSACLQKSWQADFSWEEHILYGTDEADQREYAQSLRLSVARPEDREDIEDMMGEAFEEGLRHAFGTDFVDQALPLISKISPLLLNSGTFYVMADEIGQVSACGGWSMMAPDSGSVTRGVAHLRQFATHPDYARFGLGRRIFEHCLKEARAAGAKQFKCYANLNAQTFFKAMGFKTFEMADMPIGEGLVMPIAVMLRSFD